MAAPWRTLLYQSGIVWNRRSRGRRTAWGSFCVAILPRAFAVFGMRATAVRGAFMEFSLSARFAFRSRTRRATFSRRSGEVAIDACALLQIGRASCRERVCQYV